MAEGSILGVPNVEQIVGDPMAFDGDNSPGTHAVLSRQLEASRMEVAALVGQVTELRAARHALLSMTVELENVKARLITAESERDQAAEDRARSMSASLALPSLQGNLRETQPTTLPAGGLIEKLVEMKGVVEAAALRAEAAEARAEGAEARLLEIEERVPEPEPEDPRVGRLMDAIERVRGAYIELSDRHSKTVEALKKAEDESQWGGENGPTGGSAPTLDFGAGFGDALDAAVDAQHLDLGFEMPGEVTTSAPDTEYIADLEHQLDEARFAMDELKGELAAVAKANQPVPSAVDVDGRAVLEAALAAAQSEANDAQVLAHTAQNEINAAQVTIRRLRKEVAERAQSGASEGRAPIPSVRTAADRAATQQIQHLMLELEAARGTVSRNQIDMTRASRTVRAVFEGIGVLKQVLESGGNPARVDPVLAELRRHLKDVQGIAEGSDRFARAMDKTLKRLSRLTTK